MTWTEFWDMHSGGSQKLKWTKIFIEAPEEEAKIIFQNRFGRSPDRVTCTCCGEDYSISESTTLKQATGYHRNAPYTETKRDKDGYYLNDDPNGYLFLDEGEAPPKGYKISDTFGRLNSLGEKFISLKNYAKRKDVLIIYDKDIKPKERKGELKEEGYVWKE